MFRLVACCSRTPTNVKSLAIGAACHLPKRQSFNPSSSSSTNWKSLTISPAHELRRSTMQDEIEIVLQLAGSESPRSLSKTGQNVSGAGGQLLAWKFSTALALRPFRLTTVGAIDEQFPPLGLTV